ncbi:MAG: flagellar assembly protein FliH [Pirellulaceae bacterium]|nr:flagellar assembly protein FliH [Pirellulaceae bacterium]
MATVFKSDSSADNPSATSTPAAAGGPSGLAGFNLNDLAAEGRQQLDAYRQQADTILAEARKEAESIRNDAQKQGFDEGLRLAAIDAETKLQAAAQQRAQTGLDLVQSAVDQLHTAHQQWMQDFAASLTTIALSASERIVARELTYDPRLIVSWAQQAVGSARSACRLTVAVHPETLVLLGESLDEMLSSPDLPEQTCVEPDDSVGHTEVVVRQTGGEIRAGLMAQLKRLEELLA